MPNIDKAEAVLGGFRQIIQDLVAPELREIRAILQGMTGRLDRMDARMDKSDARMGKLEDLITRGFEDVRRQLDTYKDVQLLRVHDLHRRRATPAHR